MHLLRCKKLFLPYSAILYKKTTYLLSFLLLLSVTLHAQKNKKSAPPKKATAAKRTTTPRESAPKNQVKEIYRTQSREQLENQRVSILDEIKRTQAELNDLQNDKKATLSQLKALQNKLEARQSLINNINNEIKYIENNISLANNDVQLLRTQLDTLKRQYAEMVRYTYKNKTSSDLIVFLFSSATFNDAIRRLQYVKQYRGYRADQAVKITSAHKQLTNKITVLNLEKQKKDYVLLAQEQQKKILEVETSEKDKIVVELKGKENDLMAGLAQKRKSAEDLNRAISAAIQREIDLARKRAMEEKLEQARLRKLKDEQERKVVLQKAAEERAAEERKRKAEFERKLADEKKKQEENERKLALAKKQQEENERKLADERREREEQERLLTLERQKREAAEKKAAQLADSKRIERERQLAQEKEKQEAEQRALTTRRKQHEEEQRALLAKKQAQEEEQRRLVEEKKRQEREQARLSSPNYGNPRYIPEIANKDKNDAFAAKEAERLSSENSPKSTSKASSNVKTFEKDDYKFALTPDERETASNFEASKGRLPWPVEKGYVVEHFGKNKHPLFNITTENYGIDIKTSRGARARAVFSGEVASIISIPGAAGQTVLVNHGSYFTVYAKLDKVMVTKGMKLTSKQTIGTVLTDDEGNTQINFQVWKVGANGTTSKVNPELWIAQ